MAVKISELTAAAALTGAEEIPVTQAGTTVKATPAQIKTYVDETEVWAFACSARTTSVIVGTNQGGMYAPYAATVLEVMASLETPQASGSIFTVDVNDAGASILSTKLTIDNTEGHSSSAATPAVLSDTSIAKGAKITADVDQIGDGTAKGLIVYLLVKKQ